MHDLVPPVARRSEYEMEWNEKPPLVDQGFEVINWGAWLCPSHPQRTRDCVVNHVLPFRTEDEIADQPRSVRTVKS